MYVECEDLWKAICKRAVGDAVVKACIIAAIADKVTKRRERKKDNDKRR